MHALSLCFRIGVPYVLGYSCSHARSRRRQVGRRAWSVVPPALRAGCFVRTQAGSLRFPGDPSVPLPCSQTPAEPVFLAMAVFPMLPPRPTRRRLQRFHDFEAATGLQYPLSTLHERRCRRPCKTRFRLAGSASTGRVSNPLGRNERFLVTSFLLPRTYPDASWAHARRKFYEVHQATASPIAAEALRRIAELYVIETTIRGQTAVIRQSVRQAKSLPLVGAMKHWLQAQLAHIPPRSSLERMSNGHPMSRLDDLLPWNWRPITTLN